MFEKEFQEWFERNKKWLYSSDHMQAAYHAWCAGIQQQNAAQQSFAPDVLTPRQKEEVEQMIASAIIKASS